MPYRIHHLPYFETHELGAAFINPNRYFESWWRDTDDYQTLKRRAALWQPIYCLIREHDSGLPPREFVILGGKASLEITLRGLFGPVAS